MFLSLFQQDFCAHAPSTMDASKNLPNQWLKLQSSAVLMEEESLGLVHIWSVTYYFFMVRSCFLLHSWSQVMLLSGSPVIELTLYVLVVHFLFVNCSTAFPPCLHTKYMQYCSGSWAGHLRGMILPYNMHWDCVTVLLEGKTLSDTNFK